MNGLNDLQARIRDTIAAHPERKARWKAMKQLKWRMYCPQLGLWAGMRGLDIVPVASVGEALVFDGRDNEEHKLRFYRASTGIQWEIQLCEPDRYSQAELRRIVGPQPTPCDAVIRNDSKWE